MCHAQPARKPTLALRSPNAIKPVIHHAIVLPSAERIVQCLGPDTGLYSSLATGKPRALDAIASARRTRCIPGRGRRMQCAAASLHPRDNAGGSISATNGQSGRRSGDAPSTVRQLSSGDVAVCATGALPADVCPTRNLRQADTGSPGAKGRNDSDRDRSGDPRRPYQRPTLDPQKPALMSPTQQQSRPHDSDRRPASPPCSVHARVTGAPPVRARRGRHPVEPLERLAHAEATRRHDLCQFIPANRRRDGCARFRPYRVDGSDCLPTRVLTMVDEHPLALALQPFGRDQPRVPLLERARHPLGERIGLLEGRSARNRDGP